MDFSNSEKELLIQVLQAQKVILMNNLQDLDNLIAKAKNGVVSENDVFRHSVSGTRTVVATSKRTRRNADSKFDYFQKIKWMLIEEDTALTSREILSRLYDEYSDEIDEKDDRKHIAAVSSVLYGNAPSEIELIKKDREQTRFKLKRNVSFEADEFEKELLQKQTRVDPLTELPF